MNWEKIKLTPSMSQTMFLDNQLDYGIARVIKSIKVQTLFFDKLLINRAYFLNNPDLVSIVKNQDKCGFGNLIEGGAVAPVMVESRTSPSFEKEWENGKKQNMLGLTDDEEYVKWLDRFIENMEEPVPYVTFDYTDASENYRFLIENYYSKVCDTSEISIIEAGHKKKLENLIFEKNSLEEYTRSKLYEEFDIPLRGTAEYTLFCHDHKVDDIRKSKKIIKEILDINYNFNIPSLNKFNFESVGTLPPGCDAEKNSSPIDEFSKKFNVTFIDVNKINFDDIIYIRNQCEDQRKLYLKSFEEMRKNYEKGIEDLLYNLYEYFNSISNLFQNQKYHKNVEMHESRLYLDYDCRQSGRDTFMVQELKVETDKLTENSPKYLFKMICDIGTPDDEPRTKITHLKKSTDNTNDTTIRR